MKDSNKQKTVTDINTEPPQNPGTVFEKSHLFLIPSLFNEF